MAFSIEVLATCPRCRKNTPVSGLFTDHEQMLYLRGECPNCGTFFDSTTSEKISEASRRALSASVKADTMLGLHPDDSTPH